MFQKLRERCINFYSQNEKKLEIGFFVGGFIFDALLLSDIDDPFSITQQIIYLVIIASLIQYEILYRMLKWRPGPRLEKYWGFRDLLLHFCLGSLLNLYSLFYLKSASLLGSLIFLILMISVILANELPVVKKANVSLKVGLFAICVFSFFSISFPLILGFVGWTTLLLSIISTIGVFYLQFRILQKRLPDQRTLFRSVVAPGASVLVVFVLFYFMGWIPPVPLSVMQHGVYQNVQKTEGQYALYSVEKSWWDSLNVFEQKVYVRPGDTIYYYAQIFSPARFSDEVFVQWSSQDAKGDWHPLDRIPLRVVGGRKEGFRGYTQKANYQSGHWRVQLLSFRGQEISRLYFNVVADTSTEERFFQIQYR